MAQMGTNKIAKLIRALKERKARKEHCMFVVEGTRFVNEIPCDYEIEFYAFSESFVNKNSTILYENRSNTYIFDNKVFNDFSDTETPQGILAVCRKKNFEIEKIVKNKNGLFIVAENISDPGNLGTIIRTADACGVNAVFLSKGCVDLYNSKVLRSTMGSVFHIPVIADIDIDYCIDVLKNENVNLYAAHLKGKKTLYEYNLKNSAAFVIGNEANGISESTANKCDNLIKIPMLGKAESLNASIAAAILMYEAVRQRIAK